MNELPAQQAASSANVDQQSQQNSDHIIACQGLRKTFIDGKLEVDVLKGVDLHVKHAEMLAILGTSGSGKSTLLHLLGGLDNASEGSVVVDGHSLDQLSEEQRDRLRNHSLGFVYQFHHLLPEFSALENVAMPLLIRKTNKKQAHQAAAAMLERVGLGHRFDHKPAQLSGGERQRCAIARALVTQPKAVLADEPTGNLDFKTAQDIFQLMVELNQQLGTAFVIVTHDVMLAKKMHRIMLLQAGRFKRVGKPA